MRSELGLDRGLDKRYNDPAHFGWWLGIGIKPLKDADYDKASDVVSRSSRRSGVR